MAFIIELIILGKVLLGGVAGGLIGLERESKGKPLGFRTNILVGMATVLIVCSGPLLVQFFSGLDQAILRTDPLRLMEAIVVGVSFIGAGTIIHQKGTGLVRNLTTAATILVVAGMGLAIALDKFWLATGVLIIALIVNHGLKRFEKHSMDG